MSASADLPEVEQRREVTIAYAIGDRDCEAIDDQMIDAALTVLGCDCTGDSTTCAAGDWVASSRNLPTEDQA